MSFSCVYDAFSSNNVFKTSLFAVRGVQERCRSLTSNPPALKLRNQYLQVLWDTTPSPSTEQLDLHSSLVGTRGEYSIEYAVFGIISVLCNSMNLTISFSSREIRRKYIYFVALDMGEFVNGISYILVGTGRGAGLLGGYLSTPLTVHGCFYTKYWPHFLILGTELPSFCIILISCERMCAVLRPAAYNRIFMGKYKIGLLLTVPLAGLVRPIFMFPSKLLIARSYVQIETSSNSQISVVVAGLSALGTSGALVVTTQHCAIISSTAIWWDIRNNSLPVSNN
uniref:G protein-coupled receptor n=1 Tax=Heterorhabditis bacteriophora TaxID=37862 RepID=A0A1I7X5C4_HETBA